MIGGLSLGSRGIITEGLLCEKRRGWVSFFRVREEMFVKDVYEE